MYDTFLTFIKEKGLVSDADKVLLAVSGGVDSMVMFELMYSAGICDGVAHVNYHLRGEDSNRDAELVESVCRDRKVIFHRHDVDPKVYDSAGSIQMVARKIRYDYFEELIRKYGYTRVATAHNANDNLETVLFNLTKGTGVKGLQGIAIVKGELIRPMLFAPGEVIYTYARENGVAWREDASNQKDDYARNLIRHRVVPVLREINPSLEETFESSLIRLRGAAELVKREADRIRKAFAVSGEADGLRLDWVVDDDISRMLLYELIRKYGFNFSQASDLFGAILDRRSGAQFHSDRFTISLDRGMFFLHAVDEGEEVSLSVSSGEKKVRAGGRVISFETIPGSMIHTDGHVACLDADKVRFPLTVRNWKEGDHFYPLGMRGKKKVSDFMIDSKIPVKLKKKILILESDGEIVWLAGLRIDDRFKITGATKKTLKITVEDA